MGLILPQMVKIAVANSAKYYKNLNYDIPIKKAPESVKKRFKKEYTYDTSKKIDVYVLDLQLNSTCRVNVFCDHCNKLYSIKYNDYNRYVKSDGKIYCGECARKLYSKENHWHWNSNLSDRDRELNRNNRSCVEKNEFIRKVIKRDNGLCIFCGKRADVVHHLDSWDWCKDKRFNPSNGVSLCELHHKNFHSIYGYGKNTKEQFEEWFNDKLDFVNQNIEITDSAEIFCYEESKIYTIKSFCTEYNIKNPTNLYSVLNHKVKQRDNKQYMVRTILGMHIFYLSEYNKMSQDELNVYLKPKSNGELNVISLTLGKKYNSLTEASNDCKVYKSNKSCISKCCKFLLNSSGKLPDGTPLKWMYYADYINLPLEEKEKLLIENHNTFEENSFLWNEYNSLIKKSA